MTDLFHFSERLQIWFNTFIAAMCFLYRLEEKWNHPRHPVSHLFKLPSSQRATDNMAASV